MSSDKRWIALRDQAAGGPIRWFKSEKDATDYATAAANRYPGTVYVVLEVANAITVNVVSRTAIEKKRSNAGDANFWNDQWVVTELGISTHDATYAIGAGRLTETTRRGDQVYYDWLLHMAEKEWVDIDLFVEAFSVGLYTHAYVDEGMLGESVYAALKIRRQLGYGGKAVQPKA